MTHNCTPQPGHPSPPGNAGDLVAGISSPPIFVSGHDFSRAETQNAIPLGFSPCRPYRKPWRRLRVLNRFGGLKD